ncbi:hypothetical protein ACFODZ_14600 [Marinicella sediminis]|uniref:Anti-sigma factor n=1 Tax=Marinicella sediminis TaxID=1792834 RepID=A0ABV7JBN6_9GAMM|nr:hypothetical protein [Marinicella sediminis]
MNKADHKDLNKWLNNQPQEIPPREAFDNIMDQVHQRNQSRSYRLPVLAAAVLVGLMLWLIPRNEHAQLQQLQLLTEKISMIEYVVRNEVINHSAPGSQLLEKMISMENWLDQLDENIAQTNDNSQKLDLLHAKLEILDDLVALHKKMKPSANQQVI